VEQFLSSLSGGTILLADPVMWLLLVPGVLLGVTVGALPGIGATVAYGLMLPFTAMMEPVHAVAFLLSIAVGNQFGNSIPAILIGLPGSPATILTVADGFTLHKRGETGLALGIAYVAALTGQAISTLFFIALVVPLSGLTYVFLAPELFSLYVLGMVCIVSLTGNNIAKGIAAAAFGLMIGVVGLDPVTLSPRFDFGFRELRNGLDPEPVVIGLLAVSELFRQARQTFQWSEISGSVVTRFPPLKALRRCSPAILLGTVTGTFVGAIPGAGSTPAAMISYQQARVISKKPEEFGHGSIEGIAANEAAQNAANSGELIPTLGLGLPVSGTAVLLLSALTIQGLVPGPSLVRNSPELLDASVAGLLGGTLALLIVGWWLSRFMMKLVMINRSVVIVVCLAVVMLGIYALSRQFFDVFVCLTCGVIGYFMSRYGYSVAAASLAAILSAEFERTLRQGLNLFDNDILLFLGRPITASVLTLSALVLIFGIIRIRRERRSAGAVTAMPRSTSFFGPSSEG
jgi:putative tricarboxylic transport membrane protein